MPAGLASSFSGGWARRLGQAGQLGAHVPLGVAIFGPTAGLFVASRNLAR
jgi:hypothetical protein